MPGEFSLFLRSRTWQVAQLEDTRLEPTRRNFTLKKTIVSSLAGLALAASIAASMPASLSAQVEPGAGQWKTWVIASGSALRLPPPPDAATTATEIQWIKQSEANLSQ